MKRKKQIAVFKICGCKESGLLKSLVAELLILTVPASIIGTFLYFFTFKPMMTKFFVYLSDAYSVKSIIILYIGYIAVSLIILMIMLARSISVVPVTIAKEEN